MIMFTMVLPDGAEVEAQVAKLRKAILERAPGNARAVAAYRYQKFILEQLEKSVLAWADSDKPDVRTIARDLAFIRCFQQMLRTLPGPRSRSKKRKRRGA